VEKYDNVDRAIIIEPLIVEENSTDYLKKQTLKYFGIQHLSAF